MTDHAAFLEREILKLEVRHGERNKLISFVEKRRARHAVKWWHTFSMVKAKKAGRGRIKEKKVLGGTGGPVRGAGGAGAGGRAVNSKAKGGPQM